MSWPKEYDRVMPALQRDPAFGSPVPWAAAGAPAAPAQRSEGVFAPA